jgi:outer membrane protein TolC
VARATDQNLLLMARREAVSVAEHEARRIRGTHFPTLELVAGIGNTDVGGAVTGGASNTDTTVVRVQRGYRSGVYTLLDVLDSERDLYATQGDLARALRVPAQPGAAQTACRSNGRRAASARTICST